MESGLEDRNNRPTRGQGMRLEKGLNGVRPRRPEQFITYYRLPVKRNWVSMESGLEDRNNPLHRR